MSRREAKEDKEEKEGKIELIDGRIVKMTETMVSRVRKFYEDATTSDTIFVVGKSEKLFHAHRTILALWSDGFRRMLWDPSCKERDGRKEIIAAKRDPEKFEVFLKYFYTGRIELDKDVAAEMLSLAHEYNVPPLVDACLMFMEEGADVESVCQMLNLANSMGQKNLALRYVNFICLNASTVFETQGFLELSDESVKDLFASDTLAAEEVDIFKAVLRWCEHDESKSETQYDRKAKLPELIKLVRFGLMSLEDLIKVVKPTKLLTEQQLMEYLDYIADPEDVEASTVTFNVRPREPPAKKCTYTPNFTDNTGIIYYIGTQDGKSTTYRNPIPSLIGITMSSSAGAAHTSLADRNIVSSAVENSYGREPNPWLQFEFKKHKVRLERYFIAQEYDHYLRNWRLEASNDGSKWVTLRAHTNDTSLQSAARTASWDVTCSTFYRMFRIFVTGPSHNGQNNFDITEMEFYGWVAPISDGKK